VTCPWHPFSQCKPEPATRPLVTMGFMGEPALTHATLISNGMKSHLGHPPQLLRRRPATLQVPDRLTGRVHTENDDFCAFILRFRRMHCLVRNMADLAGCADD
jgi:hypothetical protein